MKIKDFKLEEYFAKYEFKAKYILCASDCESFSIEELLSLEPEVEKSLKDLRLGYTESQGSSDLRKEISKLYSNMNLENIVIFSGAEEGIFIFMNVYFKKGDHLIVQYPAYQSLYSVALSIGCKVTRWEMSESDNWELDLNFLEKNIKKNTEAIVLNCPHNPTGYLMSKNKFHEIIEIARKYDILIFSDEVYRFLEYNDNDRLPNMCDCYEKGISLGVMSKAFGLAGLRIGWIATKDTSLLKNLMSFKNYTTICSSAPSEFISTLVLRNKDVILERNLKIIKNNLKILNSFFKKNTNHFNWIKPKAGCIAFPMIKFSENVEEFCNDLFMKKGVLLLPSTKYNYDDTHFRIGFGRKSMPQALNILEEYFQEFCV